MKRLIILSFVLMFLGTTEVLAQDPPPVFGWDVYTIPEFPTNDSISLSPSTDVNNFPQIPGYNNENSLQVNITSGGTGYAFIGRAFPEPFTMPQLCEFVVKHENGNPPSIALLVEYQGDWYQPGVGITSISNDWYVLRNNDWTDLFNGTPFPEDSIIIENAILYINGYSNADDTFIIDTWYNPNWGSDPILYDGFGDIVSAVEPIPSLLPTEYKLAQNYPNPFNPSTNIQFTIPNREFVNLTVYNALGQKVAELVNEELITGTYEFDFSGTNLPSGIYFYSLKTKNYSQTKKMMLLK